MKKHTFWLLLLCTAMSSMSLSCTKDNEGGGGAGTTSGGFNYPLTQLYGTWDCTHVLGDNGWQAVSNMFSATFYEDGSYYGRGVLGDGAGTYTAEGNTITTYIDGRLFYRYDVIEFNGTTADMKMYYGTTQAEIDNSTRIIRVRKKAETSGTKWIATTEFGAALHRSDVLLFSDKNSGKYTISVTGTRSGITDDEGDPLYPGDNQPYLDEVNYNFSYEFDGAHGSIEYVDEDNHTQQKHFNINNDTLWLEWYGNGGLSGHIPMRRF